MGMVQFASTNAWLSSLYFISTFSIVSFSFSFARTLFLFFCCSSIFLFVSISFAFVKWDENSFRFVANIRCCLQHRRLLRLCVPVYCRICSIGCLHCSILFPFVSSVVNFCFFFCLFFLSFINFSHLFCVGYFSKLLLLAFLFVFFFFVEW